uniref:Uncharacterized protein n=1 Tax=Equus asinus asinus TaxID=83772 RepID=A0A8C4LC00_EQUAS
PREEAQHRGRRDISLLTIWDPPTTALLIIESVPTDAVEGKDVLLLVTALPGNLFNLSYIIGTSEIMPGPGYNRQEKIYLDGSLLFQNATQEDTGYYTLQVLKRTLP